MKRFLLALALILAPIVAPAADNNFPTAGNATVQGVMVMCLNPATSPQTAVPCSTLAGTGGIVATNEGTLPTYTYSVLGITPAATPTDLAVITGSATKTVRIVMVRISGQASTAGTMPISLIRRSSADTGGTSTNPTAAKHDILDAGATAVVTQYSVNPASLGTTVGTVHSGRVFLNVSTAQPDRLQFDFGIHNEKAKLVRGTSDTIAINLGGAAVPTGGVIDIDVTWTEQ